MESKKITAAEVAVASRANDARTLLHGLRPDDVPLTYQQLADRLQLQPPLTIHRVVQALEWTMREDAAAGRPFIAALVVSRARGGLPAPGFFDLAKRLGRYQGGERGPAARAFHADQFYASCVFSPAR